MRNPWLTFTPAAIALAVILAAVLPAPATAAVQVNQDAPDFTLPGADGATHSLSDFRGKVVVLEWLNHDCPFVRKHYGSGNMQALQKRYTGEGVVWLSINSSAPGKQGHSTPAEAAELTAETGAAPTAVLLDPDGEVGKTYGARTTPHMFVIDPEGKLVYNGAIDDKPTTDQADVEGADNYVVAALAAVMNGETPEVQTTKPYGCSVKY
jgi:alkyl hydroperoxide reductase subunit AhpC